MSRKAVLRAITAAAVGIFAIAMLFAAFSFGDGQVTVRKRHHGAYTRSKHGTKYVAHKTKRGTKWTYRKGKHGTKWTYHKGKRGTKWTYHKTKRALH